MAITDLAGNPLAPATVGQMLGFVEVSPEEALALDVYNFVISPIRHADAQEGNLFLRRFLDGCQSVWETTQAKIFALKDLWSVTDIPDEFLPYLKNIVGWTKEEITKRVTDGIDAATLRRLIAVSVPFWKRRGPEDTIIDILGVIFGQRVRIWNWFEFRWVLDETVLDEQHQGRDPWIIELPSDGDDELRFNVRIVDPGGDSLDRELVQNIVKLMRPVGERVEVSYLEFLDLFTVPDDDLQWGNSNGIAISDGLMQLTDTGIQVAWAIVDGATAWANYSVYARMRGTTSGNFELVFYRTDSNNYYYARILTTTARLLLRKAVAGVHSTIATYDFPVPGALPAVFYGVRVHVEAEGATNRIKVYVDGELRAEVLDASHSAGSIGVAHGGATSAPLVVDEIEMFTTPLDTDTVDINAG